MPSNPNPTLTPDTHHTPQTMTDDRVLLVDNFAISIWFSLLFAVSFAGAIFGLFGVSAALAMFLIAFASSLVTLWMAYRVRHEKNAHKVYADALAIAGLIIFVVTMIEANLVIALVEMLFFLQLALNLYFREHRQIYFGLITCFVALMTGAIYTYKATYLLFILLFCLCGCFYLVLSYVDKQLGLSQQIDSPTTDSATDSAPDTSSLSSERRRLQGNWHNVERLTVAALICMVAGVIYLLMPRLPAGNLGKLPLEGWGKYQHSHFEKQLLPEDADLSDKFYKTPRDDQVAPEGNQSEANPAQNADNSGNSEHTDTSATQDNNTPSHTDSDGLTGSKAQYLRDDSIYFYVKSDRSRYLQVDVKTYFDGASWYALQYGRKHLLEDKKLFWLYAGKPNASIDISVVKDTPEHIVTTDNALAVSFPSKHLGRDYYDNLKASAMLKAGTFYQLHVSDEYRNHRLIDRHQAKPDFRDTQLPSNLDPRVAQLAKQLTQNAKTDWQKASILEQHLRQNYQYTLSTLWNQNNVPLSDFLFGKKTGHCEYFATAMAMMLRTQGIPARMVHGFVAEDFNPITGYYEVKGTNGHAWVAAYVDGTWTTFEPTGAYQSPQQPSGNTPPQADNPSADTQNETAHQQLKDYLENLAQQEDRLNDTDQKKNKTISSYLRDFWYSLLVLLEQLWQGIITIFSYLWFLLILVPLLWCAWQFWRRRYLTDWQDKQDLQRIKRHPEKSPQADIKHYMSCIQRMLARQGIQRMRGATVDSFAQRLVSEQLISANTADMLKTLVNQYFYHQQHAAAPITAKTTAATAPAIETEPQQPSKPNDTTLKPFFVALFTECKATREGKRQNH